MNDKALALVPSNITEAEAMAMKLSKSALAPEAFRDKPADAFMAIAYGLEVGLPPVSALRAVAVIKGRPTLYADAMVGLVLASGKAEYFVCVESDGTKATYETRRKGSPAPVRKSFSMDDARAAKLTGNETYQKYPRPMLEARAKAALARDVYPDMLHGIYSAEEVSEFVDVRPAPVNTSNFRAPSEVIEAEVVQTALPLDEELVESYKDKIVATGDLAELLEVGQGMKSLPDSAREALRASYSAHRARLIDKLHEAAKQAEAV